jgi:hypothetical protein
MTSLERQQAITTLAAEGVPLHSPPPGSTGVTTNGNGNGNGVKFTTRDVVQMVVYLVAVLAAFYALSDRVTRLEERYASIAESLKEIKSDVRQVKEAVR